MHRSNTQRESLPNLLYTSICGIHFFHIFRIALITELDLDLQSTTSSTVAASGPYWGESLFYRADRHWHHRVGGVMRSGRVISPGSSCRKRNADSSLQHANSVGVDSGSRSHAINVWMLLARVVEAGFGFIMPTSPLSLKPAKSLSRQQYNGKTESQCIYSKHYHLYHYYLQ